MPVKHDVYAYVSTVHGEFAPKDVVAAIRAQRPDVSADQVRRALRALTDEGLLRNLGWGRYVRTDDSPAVSDAAGTDAAPQPSVGSMKREFASSDPIVTPGPYEGRRAAPTAPPSPGTPTAPGPAGSPSPAGMADPETTAMSDASFAPAGLPPTVALVLDSVITRPLAQTMQETDERRAAAGANAGDPAFTIGVMIEVRPELGKSAEDAVAVVAALVKAVAPGAICRPTRSYVFANLTPDEIRRVITRDVDGRDSLDAAEAQRTKRAAPRRFIHRIWPNFEVRATIHRSVLTTKSEAAVRTFEATGDGIVWAVLDTGVDASHGHFDLYRNLDLPGAWHKSFVDGDDDPLADANGHGTHVAGIIAGGRTATEKRPIHAASYYRTETRTTGTASMQLDRIFGMAPKTKILSCKVLNENRVGDVETLTRALEYIQDLNRGGREMNVHGVNLSLGYTFEYEWFAAGLSPVCREVDRLVSQGVVVVVSAGNTGYGFVRDLQNKPTAMSFGMSINDPGNAERAITVGSTSIKPHSTGVSYFSSKGPTGDGRMKPDLVAPGERVVSAGTGKLLAEALTSVKEAEYVEDSGTSMAAPHVSGVAAGFLSVHREFIGRPDDVKRILMETASDLGRDRTFQGRGMVDAMRAIQSV
ncbi:S8 family serine peptidase [Microbacterium sp. 2FI]|uniref:S8 family serine peptidase n=1 Tax=Microbacterium sp. 2FI TaxID=2502193 RepID=UPI0010F78B83|nr:S8 family serine peptidase [Microbacterium sp. 2FI]